MRKFSLTALLCLCVSMLIATEMSGNYTVGIGGNYTSLTGTDGFFNAINTLGISSDVTALIITDLNETGEKTLNKPNTSFNIYIKPSSAGVKTITGTDTEKDVISINETSQVTINGDYEGVKSLKFVNNSTSKYAINAYSNSNELTVKNCIIETKAKGIKLDTNSLSSIINCDININESSGWVYAINSKSISNLNISNNKIFLNETQSTSRYVYGIQIAPLSGSTTNLYNNMIYLKSNTTSTHQGIAFIGSTQGNAFVYHNTVFIDGSLQGTEGLGAYSLSFYQERQPANLYLKNNIFVNRKTHNSSSYKVGAIRLDGITNTDKYHLDNNIYDSNIIGYYGSVAKNTLSDWQSFWSNSKEMNSRSFSPEFTSLGENIDLHIAEISDYSQYRSTEHVGIELDFDGESRNATTPFIGADEVINDDTLPVTLSSFTVSDFNNECLKLEWVTESESNMLGYHVLKNTGSNLNTAQRISMDFIRANNTSTTNKYSFTDTDVFENNQYYYWLQSFEYDGTIEYFGPVSGKFNAYEQETPILPMKTELGNAFPNPFNPTTRIEFSLANSSFTTIDIYNVKGQKVKTLMNQDLSAGNQYVIWDGMDMNNRQCTSGVYFYKMKADNYVEIKKMLLIK